MQNHKLLTHDKNCVRSGITLVFVATYKTTIDVALTCTHTLSYNLRLTKIFCNTKKNKMAPNNVVFSAGFETSVAKFQWLPNML